MERTTWSINWNASPRNSFAQKSIYVTSPSEALEVAWLAHFVYHTRVTITVYARTTCWIENGVLERTDRDIHFFYRDATPQMAHDFDMWGLLNGRDCKPTPLL